MLNGIYSILGHHRLIYVYHYLAIKGCFAQYESCMDINRELPT